MTADNGCQLLGLFGTALDFASITSVSWGFVGLYLLFSLTRAT